MKLEIGKHYITDCIEVDRIEVLGELSPGKFEAYVIRGADKYSGVLDEGKLTFDSFSTFTPPDITQCKVIGYLE